MVCSMFFVAILALTMHKPHKVYTKAPTQEKKVEKGESSENLQSTRDF